MNPKLVCDINALKNGSQLEFKKLMNAFYPRLFNFCFGYLHNSDWSREVLQDVFLSLWENREKLNPEKSIQAYLFTLTRNKCLDLIRHRKVALQFQQEALANYERLAVNYHALLDNGLDLLLTKELEEAIDEAIANLPEKARLVFSMSRFDGLKYKEIASQLNISEKTVEAHMRKALNDIRGFLSAKHTELFPLDLLLFFLYRK
jgi:RNA polymerase sigma-70 factor (ECF subfamily)